MNYELSLVLILAALSFLALPSIFSYLCDINGYWRSWGVAHLTLAGVFVFLAVMSLIFWSLMRAFGL